MKSLDDLGIKHDSDKSSKVHGYLDKYEELFGVDRLRRFTLLEIGGTSPSSAKVWSEYFPNAQIFVMGTHVHPEVHVLRNVEVVSMDNYSTGSFSAAINDVIPDVVIDDGTHKWSHQKNAIAAIFPRIREGGLYIVEDSHTVFGEIASRFSDDEVSLGDFALEVARRRAGGAPTPNLANSKGLELVESLITEVSFTNKLIVFRKGSGGFNLSAEESISSSIATKHFSFASSDYQRINGTLIGASSYISSKFERLKEQSRVGLGNIHSGILEGATVFASGVTRDKEGRILSETTNCVRNLGETHDFQRLDSQNLWIQKTSRPMTNVQRVKGRQMVLLKSPWDKNYGHWLYDSFAKLRLLEEIDLPEKPLFVINNHEGAIARVMQRSMELAGFSSEDLIPQDGAPHCFDSLLVLGNLSFHPTIKAPEATYFLESTASCVPSHNVKRVYLSRNAYNRRRLANEDKLWPIFEKLGFVKYYPEKLSFDEQLALFSGAEVVAGNMGAAFSNLAFCPEGVKVLMLATPGMAHDFFYDICCHKNGSYVAIQGESTDTTSDLNSDFTVSEEQVFQSIEMLDL